MKLVISTFTLALLNLFALDTFAQNSRQEWASVDCKNAALTILRSQRILENLDTLQTIPQFRTIKKENEKNIEVSASGGENDGVISHPYNITLVESGSKTPKAEGSKEMLSHRIEISYRFGVKKEGAKAVCSLEHVAATSQIPGATTSYYGETECFQKIQSKGERQGLLSQIGQILTKSTTYSAQQEKRKEAVCNMLVRTLNNHTYGHRDFSWYKSEEAKTYFQGNLRPEENKNSGQTTFIDMGRPTKRPLASPPPKKGKQ